ncbi:MAG: hypothetical protein KBT20_05165 [Bacteroidales bacterium]|nr:hypothetical protein [Candidatus Liminaster caballi]
MKKLPFILLTAFLSLPFTGVQAQTDDFMAEEMADFDKFIEDANKEFINFLREPWKDTEPKPAEKALPKPKPSVPVVVSEKDLPAVDPSDLPDTKPLINADKEPDVDFGFDFDADEPGVIRQGQQGSVTAAKTKNPANQKPKDKKPSAGKSSSVVPADAKPLDQKPVKPVIPTQPVVSATPSTPVVPVAPVVPSTPATPVAPAAKTPVATPSVTPVPAPSATPAPAATPSIASSSALFTGGSGRQQIDYLGMPIYIDTNLKNKAAVSGTDENSVANAVEKLASSDYKTIVADITEARKTLKLNGWATVLLVNKISENLCNSANERVILRLFLLNQLGYKCQVGRVGGELALFVSPDCKIYGIPYVTLGNQNFYDIDKVLKGRTFQLCQKLSSKAVNQIDMQVSAVPVLATATKSSTHTSRDTGASATATVSLGQMQLYKQYPQCDFSVYYKAQVNPVSASPVLEVLKQGIAGKSETEAVQYILNWCQKAFDYATDDEQFGYEKPFFVEEMFYYPKSDCEDRSILFSYLVRQLTGLKVVLLDYPNHIATGVKFSGDVKGDNVTKGSTRYVICDPTYIGASIGMAQPSFRNVKPEILEY